MRPIKAPLIFKTLRDHGGIGNGPFSPFPDSSTAEGSKINSERLDWSNLTVCADANGLLSVSELQPIKAPTQFWTLAYPFRTGVSGVLQQPALKGYAKPYLQLLSATFRRACFKTRPAAMGRTPRPQCQIFYTLFFHGA